MAKALLIRNTNKQEFFAFVDSLEMNVDGVNSVDVVDSNYFTGDKILMLNDEKCSSVRFDDFLNSIALYIERYDSQIETLLNIWNYTFNNYIVELLEDEF